MNGRFRSVSSTLESSIFAFSAASFRRWRAILSLRRSIPCSFARTQCAAEFLLQIEPQFHGVGRSSGRLGPAVLAS